MVKSPTYSNLKITGERVFLRPYKMTDFKNCQAAHKGRFRSKGKFDNEIPTCKEASLGKFKTRLERYKKNWKSGHQFVFGIFNKADGSYIGQIDILTLNQQLRWGNLGYVIHNQYWSKGYATESSKLALKIAFTKMNFHRLEAATETRHKPSIRVAVKSGLKHEGIRRKFFSDNGGIDMVVYATNAFDYK